MLLIYCVKRKGEADETRLYARPPENPSKNSRVETRVCETLRHENLRWYGDAQGLERPPRILSFLVPHLQCVQQRLWPFFSGAAVPHMPGLRQEFPTSGDIGRTP